MPSDSYIAELAHRKANWERQAYIRGLERKARLGSVSAGLGTLGFGPMAPEGYGGGGEGGGMDNMSPMLASLIFGEGMGDQATKLQMARIAAQPQQLAAMTDYMRHMEETKRKREDRTPRRMALASYLAGAPAAGASFQEMDEAAQQVERAGEGGALPMGLSVGTPNSKTTGAPFLNALIGSYGPQIASDPNVAQQAWQQFGKHGVNRSTVADELTKEDPSQWPWFKRLAWAGNANYPELSKFPGLGFPGFEWTGPALQRIFSTKQPETIAERQRKVSILKALLASGQGT